MSLVGSLDDLALCDLLQILSLAGKSGLLSLRSPEGDGWILFAAGQVAGAGAKGGPPDLAALLQAHGLESGADLPPDQLEAIRRDAVEAAVVRMLGWPQGDFRLDSEGAEERARATGLRLATPIPSQYLALEGVRMQDEGDVTVGEATPVPPELPSSSERLPYPLVVIDPSPGALEWLKHCLGGSFLHVHIFQNTGLGVTRIRQYLARGEQPVVLLARDARPDGLSGIRDAAELVMRFEQQAPRMPILVMVERDGVGGAVRAAPLRGVAGVVARPTEDRLRDPRFRSEVAASSEALRRAVVGAIQALRRG